MEMSVQQIAKVAAEWWVNLIQKQHQAFGNNRASAVWNEVLGPMADLKDEYLALFEAEMANRIEQEMSKPSFRNLVISCDYEPQGILASSAEVAQIDEDRFPKKAKLVIEPNLIRVSVGYGGKWESIHQW